MWDNDVGTACVRRRRERRQRHVSRRCRWNVVASSINDDCDDGIGTSGTMMLVLLVSDASADVINGTFRVVDGTACVQRRRGRRQQHVSRRRRWNIFASSIDDDSDDGIRTSVCAR